MKKLNDHSIDSLFSKLETNARRKREEHWRKKVCSCSEVFFVVTRIPLIWLDIFLARVNCEAKRHADWTNRHILKKWNVKKNKTKLSVSNLLIKSLWPFICDNYFSTGFAQGWGSGNFLIASASTTWWHNFCLKFFGKKFFLISQNKTALLSSS